MLSAANPFPTRMKRTMSTASLSRTDRTYENLLRLLNGQKRQRRPSTQDEKASNTVLKGSDWRGTPSIVGMKEWLQVLGHTSSDLESLNAIHIAGTKGKGSTCAFTESILRNHGRRTGFPAKVGLYTSPHLRHLEERVRINFEPVPKSMFMKYFYEVHERLFVDSVEKQYGLPKYLQLLALVSLHTFIREKVDVAIFETHHGGEFDSTNVLEKPSVAAVTTLGMDHVNQLGPTIENIAWHKSGIFKPGAAALTSSEWPEAIAVLRQRATDRQSQLEVVKVSETLPASARTLQPGVQRLNASLATAIAREFLARKGPPSEELTAEDILKGVDQFSWPGRFQTVSDGRMTWFIDSAHNEMSVTEAATWFVRNSEKQEVSPSRILIFSQITTERDTDAVVRLLAKSLKEEGANIKHVIFSSYSSSEDTRNPKHEALLSDQRTTFDAAWNDIDTSAKLWHELDVDKALDLARKLGSEYDTSHVLITGSQHLVGSALDILLPEEEPNA